MSASNVIELCHLEVAVLFVSRNDSLGTSRNLKFQVLLSGSVALPQLVKIRVTDDKDSQFLLISCIAGEDYPSLKQSQGLLVEFSSFPQKLVELLKLCDHEQRNSHPKFSLALNDTGQLHGSASPFVLEVIESNPFKRLCHLSLNAVPATTQDKLDYLSECLDILKSSHSKKEKDLEMRERIAHQQLQSCKEQLQLSEAKAKELQLSCAAEMRTAKSENEAKLQEYRERILKIQSDCDRRMDRLRSDTEGKMTARSSQHQQRIDALLSDNRVAAEARAAQEATNRELRSQLVTAEKNVSQLRREISQLSAAQQQLLQQQSAFSAKEKGLQESLQTALADKEQLLKSLDSYSQQLHDNKSLIEDLRQSLESVSAKCRKREASATKLFVELQKSLETIKKLQDHNSSLLQQNKECNVKLGELQSKVDKDAQTAEQNKQYFLNLKADLDKEKETRIKLELETEELKKKIAEEQGKNKTNDNMITWLNKRLSEAENTTALVKRVPLAGAYLPSSKGHREAKRTASLPHGPDNTDCIVDSIAQKAMQNYRTSVNTATSTPLTENTGHPPRLRPNSAFNSLSAVQTPKSMPILPEHQEDAPDADDKENSPDGLATEYLTATKAGYIPVSGLIGSKGSGEQETVPDRVVQVVSKEADSVQIISSGQPRKGLLRDSTKKNKWKY